MIVFWIISFEYFADASSKSQYDVDSQKYDKKWTNGPVVQVSRRGKQYHDPEQSHYD